jgi:hypothetical protein
VEPIWTDLSELEAFTARLMREINTYQRRVAGSDPEGLAHVLRVQEAAAGILHYAVPAMREHNPECSWARIGRVFGVTRQAAQQRWGRPIDR